MSDPFITSAANPRVKHLAALRTRRGRAASGLTCLEGREELELALRAGLVPRTLFYCAELMAPGGAALVGEARARGAETVALGRAAFARASYREGPDGFLALAPAPGVALAQLEVPRGGLVLIAQAVEKPGNLGAMLRTADAAGVAAVVAADPVTDWGNPNVIRASKGTVFSMPVASADTAATLAWLVARGYALVATTPSATLLHTEAELTGSVAIAVGAEKWGLDPVLLEAAAIRVRIPMAGQADSLNAATSAAIVLFEAVRQRGIRS